MFLSSINLAAPFVFLTTSLSQSISCFYAFNDNRTYRVAQKLAGKLLKATVWKLVNIWSS